MLSGIEQPGVIDFGEIVIFGGKPKDGDRGNTLPGKLRGEFYGGERLVDGVGRTGEQAYLLTSQYGNGAGFGKFGKQRRAGILTGKGRNESGAAIIGIRDGGGGTPERFRIRGRVIVEPCNTIEMVQVVREEFRGVGKFGMPDTMCAHSRPP